MKALRSAQPMVPLILQRLGRDLSEQSCLPRKLDNIFPNHLTSAMTTKGVKFDLANVMFKSLN